MTVSADAEARFWARVDKTAECWNWTGSIQSRGYGDGSFGGRRLLVHRLSWELAHDEAPPRGLSVLHRCDNRRCVRPEHLFLGTPADNTLDMMQKGRQVTCKLTRENAIAIREACAAGVAYRQLAMQYGVSPSTIKAVASRQNWDWVQ
jgi:hypothetical protein